MQRQVINYFFSTYNFEQRLSKWLSVKDYLQKIKTYDKCNKENNSKSTQQQRYWYYMNRVTKDFWNNQTFTNFFNRHSLTEYQKLAPINVTNTSMGIFGWFSAALRLMLFLKNEAMTKVTPLDTLANPFKRSSEISQPASSCSSCHYVAPTDKQARCLFHWSWLMWMISEFAYVT